MEGGHVELGRVACRDMPELTAPRWFLVMSPWGMMYRFESFLLAALPFMCDGETNL